MGGLSNGHISNPNISSNPNLGIENSPFQIAVKRMEIDENMKRARLIRHFLALNLCIEQSYSFRQNPNE